jgi:hypothetical protein
MTKCELCGETTSRCVCKKNRPLKIRFCPECKSSDVKFVFKLKNLFGLVPRMTCMKCGNHAPDFPIAIVPAKKKKTIKKKKITKRTKKKGSKKK